MQVVDHDHEGIAEHAKSEYVPTDGEDNADREPEKSTRVSVDAVQAEPSGDVAHVSAELVGDSRIQTLEVDLRDKQAKLEWLSQCGGGVDSKGMPMKKKGDSVRPIDKLPET